MLGCSRAHACWCLCSPVPTHCLSPPDSITELLDPASAPQEQLQVRFRVCQSPTEGAGGTGGEHRAVPGCSCSQQQPTASSLSTPLPCHPYGDTQDDCNHCPSRNTIYLWPNSHCLVWINQKENKALRKKVLNFPCAPEGMGQALAVYFLGSLFASTVSDIVFTKVFMSSEQSHSSASSPVYFM